MEKVIKLAFKMKPLAKIKNAEGEEELCFTKPTDLSEFFNNKEKLCEAKNITRIGEVEIVKPVRRVLYKPYSLNLTLEQIMLTLQAKLTKEQQGKVVAFEPVDKDGKITVVIYELNQGETLPTIVKEQPVIYFGKKYTKDLVQEALEQGR